MREEIVVRQTNSERMNKKQLSPLNRGNPCKVRILYIPFLIVLCRASLCAQTKCPSYFCVHDTCVRTWWHFEWIYTSQHYYNYVNLLMIFIGLRDIGWRLMKSTHGWHECLVFGHRAVAVKLARSLFLHAPCKANKLQSFVLQFNGKRLSRWRKFHKPKMSLYINLLALGEMTSSTSVPDE